MEAGRVGMRTPEFPTQEEPTQKDDGDADEEVMSSGQLVSSGRRFK